MKITDRRKKETYIYFKDLRCGDCFWYKHKPYVKFRNTDDDFNSMNLQGQVSELILLHAVVIHIPIRNLELVIHD